MEGHIEQRGVGGVDSIKPNDEIADGVCNRKLTRNVFFLFFTLLLSQFMEFVKSKLAL